VDTVLQGSGDPRVLVWPPVSPAYDAAKNAAYSFDLDKAKALLAEAGVSGFEVEIIWNSIYNDLKGLAEIYQNDLAKLGLKAVIRPLEAVVWRDVTQGQKYRGLNLTFAPVHLQPDYVAILRNFSPEGNSSGFKSERYSQLVEALSTELDPAKRKQLYNQFNDLMLDESFVIGISAYPTNVVTTTKVRDVRYTMHEALTFTEAWLGA
jgi:peptide/nickel transport system substrate-binding protein